MNSRLQRPVAGLGIGIWLALAVLPPVNAQPNITTQPVSRMVAQGVNASFRVIASGVPPSGYQWYFNGLARTGATNASLTLTNVQRDLAGQYFAVVSSASGAVTSRVARLDVYLRSGIFDIADPDEFGKILSTNAVLTRMATLNSWIEGVVWIPSEGGYLVFSDIGNNRLKKLVPPSTLTDFLTPPQNTRFNGNLLDLNERLISCQAGSAALRVVLTTNGVTVPLLTNYVTGTKFYSPNDLAIRSDGSIWFTDPGYDSGLPLPPPTGSSIPPGFQPGLYVYRFFQNNAAATVLQVITNMSRPNGLCFSADETKLYVADSASAPGPIRAFDVTPGNQVTGGAVLCTIGSGVADGIKCDVDGRIWSSAEDGIEIFAPDGHLIGRIRMTRAANLCFGGPDYKTLYIVGQPYVSSIPVLVPGAISIKRLKAAMNGSQIKIAWPAPSTGFTLQQSDKAGDLTTWTNVSETITISNRVECGYG